MFATSGFISMQRGGRLSAVLALTLGALAAGCDGGTVMTVTDAGGDAAVVTDTGVVADTGAPSDTGVPTDAPTPGPVFAAVVRGRLASSDIAMARTMHNQIAAMGRADAIAAGNFAHDVLLGTTYLDSIENEFVAIDRWSNATTMRQFYSNPALQAAFATLFAEAPTVEFFTAAPDWVNWGTMESGDAFDPHFIHFALGLLARTDTGTNKAAHDMVAMGGRSDAIAAGGIAHVVFLGLDNPRRFLGVDIWNSGAPIVPVYTNPMFRMVYAPLFETLTEPVYQSTDWEQW